MSVITLLHQSQSYSVSQVDLIVKCKLFQKLARTNPSVFTVPYHVTSSVHPNIFKQFITAIENQGIEITRENFLGLSILCEEFGFDDLSTELSKFRVSIGNESEFVRDIDARERILKLEEGFERQQDEFALLQFQIIELKSHSREEQSHVNVFEQFEQFEQRFSDLQCQLSRVTNMEKQLSEVTSGLRIVDNHTQSIGDRVYSLNQRLEDFTDLENNLEGMESEVKRLNQKLQIAQQRISVLESKILEKGKEVTDLNSKLKMMEMFEKRLEKFNEFEIEITRFKTQIERFDSSLKSNQQQISTSIESKILTMRK
jgi:uncharacterized protein (DUF3084 family)